ncbi:MAG: hypothetical protein V1835_02340 [Candidatus Micrarchaeota archaeon]
MIEDQLAQFAVGIFSNVESLTGRFGVTVLILTFGIAIYAAIVGTFYNFLSRRVLFELDSEKRGGLLGFILSLGHVAIFFFKYTLMFPAITFIYFVLISTFLFLLSRTAELETVFLLSISLVSAIRLLAYYKEEIAVDLAKMLPLALLGVLIVEPTLFSKEIVESRLTELLGALPSFVGFIGFTVVIEWVLRIFYFFARLARGKSGVEKK